MTFVHRPHGRTLSVDMTYNHSAEPGGGKRSNRGRVIESHSFA